jgi:hypothetical protein
VLKTSAKRNSFHAAINVRMAVVNIPGVARGIIILKNACIGVAPSTFADSSSSKGISLKNEVKIHKERGIAKVVYVNISPR